MKSAALMILWGEWKKRRLHAAKFEIHVKYVVTSDGHNSFSFEARKKLKASTETLKYEEKVYLNRKVNLFLEDTFIQGTKCSVWLIFRKSVSCLVKF